MIDLFKTLRRAFIVMLVSACFSAVLYAQAGISLHGQVTDPSGAAIPAATVTLDGPGGATQQAQTNEQGQYVFRNLAPGAYTLLIDVKGFAEFSKTDIEIAPGKPQVVNAQLVVSIEKQEVTVQSEAAGVSVSPDNNVSALVLKGEDLKTLSDDPDDLQDELEALAGPSAGPNGGQIYIDGFTGGQLPPKSAILEVRVNQNPFSAQYDRLGYGRIDIITKPGFQQFHGGAFVFGNDSSFNSRNPFAAEVPGYHSEYYNGNVGGPLGKKASFFLDMYRRNVQDASVVNAIVLDPNFNQSSFSQAVLSPRTRTNISPRADFQLSNNNVLSIRYQLWRDSNINNGIGQFSLPSQAYNSGGTDHSIQISDTQVVSARTVNQTRFRYRHDIDNQVAQSLDPAINVLGAFTGGGNSQGTSESTANHYELQNMTSMSLGKHTLTFGGRLRDLRESLNSTSGYNGTFTFDSLNTYAITEQGLAQGLTPAEILAAGGGARQFVITAGNPLAKVNLFDLGLYAEDEWRMRPNVSLTLGLRFETQNQINDHADIAPRVGLAWGIGGKTSKTVLRAGYGLFYDRFEEEQVLQAEQLNGINQQRFVVNSPDFFPIIPPTSSLVNAATFPTIYQIDPNLQAPYVMETAVGLERQIAKNVKASVTYINSHGIHQLLTRNINAPLPGTYDPANPSSGVRPFGDVGNIYQYESDGLFNENQLIANFNVRMDASLSLFGYYTLSYANSNTDGVSSFPMNPYNIGEDYGPAAFAVRNRFFMGGSVGLPYGFSLSPFMVLTSGRPYDVTTGQDLNGDSIFNDRPAFAASGATGPNIVMTQLGSFNTDPLSGQPVIPVNDFTGPGQFSMNMRLSKTFGFGKEVEGGGGGFGGGHHHGGGGLGGRGLSGGGGGGFFQRGSAENKRYQLEFGVMAHNIFNKVNLGTPVGNLSSPIFGLSNSLAGGFFGGRSANRSINMYTRFTF